MTTVEEIRKRKKKLGLPIEEKPQPSPEERLAAGESYIQKREKLASQAGVSSEAAGKALAPAETAPLTQRQQIEEQAFDLFQEALKNPDILKQVGELEKGAEEAETKKTELGQQTALMEASSNLFGAALGGEEALENLRQNKAASFFNEITAATEEAIFAEIPETEQTGKPTEILNSFKRALKKIHNSTIGNLRRLNKKNQDFSQKVTAGIVVPAVTLGTAAYSDRIADSRSILEGYTELITRYPSMVNSGYNPIQANRDLADIEAEINRLERAIHEDAKFTVAKYLRPDYEQASLKDLLKLRTMLQEARQSVIAAQLNPTPEQIAMRALLSLE